MPPLQRHQLHPGICVHERAPCSADRSAAPFGRHRTVARVSFGWLCYSTALVDLPLGKGSPVGLAVWQDSFVFTEAPSAGCCAQAARSLLPVYVDGLIDHDAAGSCSASDPPRDLLRSGTPLRTSFVVACRHGGAQTHTFADFVITVLGRHALALSADAGVCECVRLRNRRRCCFGAKSPASCRPSQSS